MGGASRDEDGNDGPAPLVAELEAILAHALYDQHVILVDDIHKFVRGTAWGAGVWKQVKHLRRTWLAEHPAWVWNVKDNVLRIYKAEGMLNKKRYPVWQLMDGTVVVQGSGISKETLKAGKFRWVDVEQKNSRRVSSRVRYQLYKILEIV